MDGHHSFQPAAVYSQRKAFLTPRMVISSSQDQGGVECVQRCVRNSPSYCMSPQGGPKAWFTTLFSSYALLSATLSSTPFPVKAQWHEGRLAISTYGTSYAVLSAWVTPLIAFPLCPDKDEFCSHWFLEASMPEAGWLPWQSGPIVCCDFSKVALPGLFPPCDKLLEGRNCGSPFYCLPIGSGPEAYQE